MKLGFSRLCVSALVLLIMVASIKYLQRLILFVMPSGFDLVASFHGITSLEFLNILEVYGGATISVLKLNHFMLIMPNAKG